MYGINNGVQSYNTYMIITFYYDFFSLIMLYFILGAAYFPCRHSTLFDIEHTLSVHYNNIM